MKRGQKFCKTNECLTSLFSFSVFFPSYLRGCVVAVVCCLLAILRSNCRLAVITLTGPEKVTSCDAPCPKQQSLLRLANECIHCTIPYDKAFCCIVIVRHVIRYMFIKPNENGPISPENEKSIV